MLLLLLAARAHATPPDVETQQQVEALVTTQLLQPLAKRDDERSRFSRARMPPAERRVRVLDSAVDVFGDTFFRFVVDARGGIKQTWQPNTIVGCAYLEQRRPRRPTVRAVFVDRSASGIGSHSSDVRDASVVLGKKVAPAEAGTCVARPATG